MNSSQQVSQGAAKAQAPLLSNQLIILLYAGLLLYFAYVMYKGNRQKKKLQGAQFAYRPTLGKLNMILSVFVLLAGVMSIVAHQWISGILMMLVVVMLFVKSREPVILAKNGIFGDDKFYAWTEIKQWAWDKQRGDLVLLTKEFGKNEVRNIIHVGPDHMMEVNEKIRELKLNKGKAK